MNQSARTLSYGDFVNKMKGVFDHPDRHGNAVKRLLNLWSKHQRRTPSDEAL